MRARSFALLLAGSLAFGHLHADQQPSRNPGRAGEAPPASTKLDLNSATKEELTAVPVIGADGAAAIIALRPFRTINDLDRLQGLSPERLEQIRAQVTVATIPVSALPEGMKPPAETIRPEPPASSAQTSATPAAPTPGIQAARDGRLNLNTVDPSALAWISEIGPDLAAAIVAARPFASIDDLGRIQGMSAERIAAIRNRVYVAPPPAESAGQRPEGPDRGKSR